jgi:hypothetical protein
VKGAGEWRLRVALHHEDAQSEKNGKHQQSLSARISPEGAHRF